MMTTMNRYNCTTATAHAASCSAMGTFSEPSAQSAAMNLILNLDAAILAASILFILISRIIVVTPS